MKSVNKERHTQRAGVKANSGHEAASAAHSVSIVGRNTFPAQKIELYICGFYGLQITLIIIKKLLPLIKFLL